jgi:hypothetical protein
MNVSQNGHRSSNSYFCSIAERKSRSSA